MLLARKTNTGIPHLVVVYLLQQPAHPEEVTIQQQTLQRQKYITQQPLLQPIQQHVHLQVLAVRLIIIGITQLVVAGRMSHTQLVGVSATHQRTVVIQVISGIMIRAHVSMIPTYKQQPA
jgi:hypothetical protein